MAEFRVSRLRLQRAKEHSEALATLWNKLPTDKLCELWPRVHPSGFGEIRVIGAKPVPDEFSLRLGELLYQLRSALDACIYRATAYSLNRDPPPRENSLEFPITNDPAEFPKLRKRRLWGLSNDIQDGLELVQPYNTPLLPPEQLVSNVNRNLGLLHELARKDRHRKLHVVGSMPLRIDPEFQLPPGVRVISVKTDANQLIEVNTVIAKFQLEGFKSGMQLQLNPHLATNIGCSEPPPACCPEDTFPRRLAEMMNAVHSVISAFENYKF